VETGLCLLPARDGRDVRLGRTHSSAAISADLPIERALPTGAVSPCDGTEYVCLQPVRVSPPEGVGRVPSQREEECALSCRLRNAVYPLDFPQSDRLLVILHLCDGGASDDVDPAVCPVV
jgi:hypothetical protein